MKIFTKCLGSVLLGLIFTFSAAAEPVQYVPTPEEAEMICTQGAMDWLLQYYIAKDQGVPLAVFLANIANPILQEFITQDFAGNKEAANTAMDKAVDECINKVQQLQVENGN